jgi:hypothetical protein
MILKSYIYCYIDYNEKLHDNGMTWYGMAWKGIKMTWKWNEQDLPYQSQSQTYTV